MNARVLDGASHPATFLVAATAVYACSVAIAGLLADHPDAAVVALGVTCDLVLVVPALYYLLLVRGRGWRAIGVVPLFLLGLVVASSILPPDQRQLLSGLEWVAVPLELLLVVYVGKRAVVSLRRARSRVEGKHEDVFTAIRHAAREVVGSPRVGEVIAQEIATLYYALASWKTPLPEADRGFTSYRRNSYGLVVWGIGMVLVIETVAVHLAVHMLWSAAAAWILTVLGVYGLLWMIGDFQALRLRVTTVSPRRIDVRLGTRWEITIPRDALLAVEETNAVSEVAGEESAKPLNLTLIGGPDVEIRLSRPVTARGLFGLRRATTRIRLQIDDPRGFIDRVLHGI